MLFCFGFQCVILLKQYKMANIQFKKVIESNKKRLQLLHKKFLNKTISTLIADTEKQKAILKKQLNW